MVNANLGSLLHEICWLKFSGDGEVSMHYTSAGVFLTVRVLEG